MRIARSKMSRHADVAKAVDYMLKRWPTFSRFVDDGRILCMTNNDGRKGAERSTLRRKSWLFAGSDRGRRRGAAAMYSLIVTAKLGDVDPRALARRRACPRRRSCQRRVCTNSCRGIGPNQSYPLAPAA